MESKIKRFGIYHPKGGMLNVGCEPHRYEFEYITSVDAENLVRSFYRAQNDFNPEYAALGKRSTSVGDIITTDLGVYMILGSGYKKIPKDRPLYKSIKEIDDVIVEELKSKLTQEDVDELLDNCV